MRGFLFRMVIAAATIATAGIGLAVTVRLLSPQVFRFVTAVDSGEQAPLQFRELDTRSVVYAADGTELKVVFGEQNRFEVPLREVPPHVVRSVLDAEDERFWEHGALDLRSLTRALVSNLESGGVLEGGSTITQQLVKNAFLSPKQDLKRKIQEAFLALRLEDQMSKPQILERYLNTVYFGNGAYGVGAAAERYFRTDVQSLSLGQGILLASLIRNPAGADPWVYPEQAVARRDAVIDRMAHLGHVTPEQAAQLKTEPLPPPPEPRPPRGSDYFVRTVELQLLSDPRFNLGETYEERVQRLFRGGLRIETTLNPAYQRAAEEKVADILPDSGGQFTAALVSVEVGTGAVRALVGGPDFGQAQFNLVTQGGRQVGSAFKTMTLVAALESGYIPEDRISGVAPCKIPNPGGEDDPWEVKNAGDGAGWANMTLADATVNSVNCAYARLIKLVGPAKVVEVANRMGVSSELPKILSLTLGSASVSPLDMAASYATLAADGVRSNPYFIRRVTERNGTLVYEETPAPERAISVEHARTVTDILTDVTTRGTGTAARVRGWTVAGKTGSTDNNADAWFVGYTPELATAVWMGSPVAQVPMTNVGGVRVFGGTYPARIWGAYMSAVVGDREPVRFPLPERRTTRIPRLLLLDGESPNDFASVTPNRSTTPARPSTTQAPTSTSPPTTGSVPTVPDPEDLAEAIRRRVAERLAGIDNPVPGPTDP